MCLLLVAFFSLTCLTPNGRQQASLGNPDTAIRKSAALDVTVDTGARRSPNDTTAPPAPLAPSLGQPQAARIDSSLQRRDSAARHEPSPESWTDRYIWTPAAGALFALAAAVVAAIIYDRLKRRITIEFVCKNKLGVIEDIHSLYVHRIESTERVSPQYLTHCLVTPQECIQSTGDFRRQCRRGALPEVAHLLLVARHEGDVVGLIKGIFISSVGVFFIAYAAVQPGAASVERRAMRMLLSSVRQILDSKGPVKWVAFELTNTDSAVTGAKDRLFRHYARSFGLILKRVEFEYLQPDLDCTALDKCKELPAVLYMAANDGATPSAISLVELRGILLALMRDIYVNSWLIDHDANQRPALLRYVDELTELMLDGLDDQVPLT